MYDFRTTPHNVKEFFYSLNVHGEGRAPLLRASPSTVRLDNSPILRLRLSELVLA
jgi:hypothetical protein